MGHLTVALGIVTPFALRPFDLIRNLLRRRPRSSGTFAVERAERVIAIARDLKLHDWPWMAMEVAWDPDVGEATREALRSDAVSWNGVTLRDVGTGDRFTFVVAIEPLDEQGRLVIRGITPID